MQKFIIGMLFTTLIFISGCTANHLEIFPELSDSTLSSKKISSEKLREDVDALIAGIIERHPDVERYANLEMIKERVSELKAELTTSMTRQEFFKKVGALSHLFNDGHTFLIWPYQEYQALKEKGGLIFPFNLDVYSGDVFLKYEYHHNGSRLPKGSRLVSINNTEIEKIFSKAQQYVGGETEILRKHTVADRFPMMLWAVFGFEENFELILEVNGENRLVNISADDNWQKEMLSNETENNDFVYYQLNADTGFLKIATFDVSPDWFESFIDETFKKIHQQKIHNLIIDIRENGGGNTDTATYLAKHLASSPFQMISSMRERLNIDNRGLFNYKGDVGDVLTKDWDEWIEPLEDDRRFDGKTYVLISPMSYSSAIVFATAVKDNNMATLVGRETGGYANQTAQGNLFNLPNSELRVYVATRLLIRPSGNLKVNGVMPDIIVSASDSQIRAGEDADMQAALKDTKISKH
ncbi:MAG: S41 family peptidase [Kangiellaceae bacterium]|jgi:hypothetical protein|nr:S41 family peptidase [Kangiellaceae bacterium]